MRSTGSPRTVGPRAGGDGPPSGATGAGRRSNRSPANPPLTPIPRSTGEYRENFTLEGIQKPFPIPNTAESLVFSAQFPTPCNRKSIRTIRDFIRENRESSWFTAWCHLKKSPSRDPKTILKGNPILPCEPEAPVEPGAVHVLEGGRGNIAPASNDTGFDWRHAAVASAWRDTHNAAMTPMQAP